MSAIFISYRRSGARHTAYRLKDKLKDEFGDDQVFIDLEDIPGGAPYAEVIPDAIARASVILILIGPKWLDIGTEDGRRRLEEEDDWVRQEVEAALHSSAKVIPVLVDGAAEIDVARLPTSIRTLSALNYFEISPKEAHWRFDTHRLIEQIKHTDPSLVRPAKEEKRPLSGKAIWSLVLVAIVIFGVASEDSEFLDHDSAIGGIALGVVALILAVWAFLDVQADRVRGKGAAIAGIALGILATLAMIGSLPGPNQPPVPMAQSSPTTNAVIDDGLTVDLNALPPPAAIPSSPPTIDVSGTWISNEGLLYRVQQEGSSIVFNEFDTDGTLVGTGIGTIQGNRVESEFRYGVEGPGRSLLTLSDDGMRMSGSYQLLRSGETGQTLLFRQ